MLSDIFSNSAHRRVAAVLLAFAGALSVFAAEEEDAHDAPPVLKRAVATETKDADDAPDDKDQPKRSDAGRDADVVDLEDLKKQAAAVPHSIDSELDEDAVKTRLKVLKERQAARERELAALSKQSATLQKTSSRPPAETPKTSPKPLENVAVVSPDVQLALPPKIVTEPGYASVLTGPLQFDTTLRAEALPHLIRGTLVVPAKLTLKIEAGAVIHLRADTSATKPLQTGSPDPTKSAVVWVYGTLLVAGENGRPVEFAGQDKDNANLLLYGAEQSKLDSARFRTTDVAQNGGVVQWTNCEFNDSKYYALAAGAGIFTHCSFRKCGGIFAAYDEGPWALLARRCLFENCRDGLLLNRDPGQACLLVEKNNFTGTRGANLRAMPRPVGTTTKTAEELLIGENWYGTSIDEEVDRRIVDRRTDPSIKAHLNTRPPSDKPFANTGAGAPQTVISSTLLEQQKAVAKMLDALAAKQKLKK